MTLKAGKAIIGLMKIGILGALDEEIKLLLDNLEQPEPETKLRHNFYQGTLAGHQVVVATSGIGKVRAAARTQFLIDRFSVHRIILVGIAGAVNPLLKLGDVIISRRAVQHDFELATFSPREDPYWYEASSQLMELAAKAAENLGWLEKVHLGSVLSGDQVVTRLSKKQQLWQTFGGDCVEMEGAAVAAVCWMNDIPFVLIRTISDLAQEGISSEIQEWSQQAAYRSAAVALEMLRIHPPEP